MWNFKYMPKTLSTCTDCNLGLRINLKKKSTLFPQSRKYIEVTNRDEWCFREKYRITHMLSHPGEK